MAQDVLSFGCVPIYLEVCMDTIAYPASHRLESLLRERIGGQVCDLEITLQDNGIVLHGLAHSYYAKQLAQHLAMQLTGRPIVANEIEVP